MQYIIILLSPLPCLVNSYLFLFYLITSTFLTGCCASSQFQVYKACIGTVRYNVGGLKWNPINHRIRYNDQTSTLKKNKELIRASATSGHPLDSQPEADNVTNGWKSTLSSVDAFYRFSRPHTVIGTVKLQTWGDLLAKYCILLLILILAFGVLFSYYMLTADNLFNRYWV